METSKNEKNKAIDLAVSAIEKQFGKGSIMRLGAEQSLYGDIPVISSGALSLDMALGIGGYPRGESLKFMDQKVLVKPLLH